MLINCGVQSHRANHYTTPPLHVWLLLQVDLAKQYNLPMYVFSFNFFHFWFIITCHNASAVSSVTVLWQNSVMTKALSTLSHKSATVAENGETTAKFGDCRTFLRLSHFCATVSLLCDSLTFLQQIVALFCDSVDRLLMMATMQLFLSGV